MKKIMSLFLAWAVAVLTTGCLSGTYKLTKEYSMFVIQQPVVIRVVLYILTFVVFPVTLLIDVVINNTMEFWHENISIGDYKFESGGKTYLVRHEKIEGLKRSTIRVFDSHGHKRLQEVVLNQTKQGDIEVFVDGHLKTKVQNISEAAPIATAYDTSGNVTGRQMIIAVR